MAERVEPLLDQIGDGRFAGAGQTREPQDARLLVLAGGMGLLVDFDRLPVNVLGAPQREMDQAGADGAVGHAVDQDEAAGIAVLGVGVERDRLVEAQDCRRRFR